MSEPGAETKAGSKVCGGPEAVKGRVTMGLNESVGSKSVMGA